MDSKSTKCTCGASELTSDGREKYPRAAEIGHEPQCPDPRATPAKRPTGQCTCSPIIRATCGHCASCPALYPRQPAPGDEPDVLTRLVRLVRMGPESGSIAHRDVHATKLLDLISEARAEKALADMAILAANVAAEALKRGQQSASEARRAAFRELAAVLLDMPAQVRDGYLRRMLEAHGGES